MDVIFKKNRIYYCVMYIYLINKMLIKHQQYANSLSANSSILRHICTYLSIKYMDNNKSKLNAID